jgi:hypothetical protein
MRRSFKTAFTAVALACLLASPSSSDRLRVAQQPGDVVAEQEKTAAPSVTVLGSMQAEGILGKEVRSSADENLGRIIDVVVDRAGNTRAAVIDFGGFLGVGSRKIAVDWSALRFIPDSDKRDIVTLELTRDQVKAAPEYKEKRAVIVLGAAAFPQRNP